MSSFALTNKALADLRVIALYTDDRWGKEQRRLYLKQLDDSFHLLAANPALGTCCAEIMPGYRKFLQGRHLIFFKDGVETTILIVRILYQSMDVTVHL